MKYVYIFVRYDANGNPMLFSSSATKQEIQRIASDSAGGFSELTTKQARDFIKALTLMIEDAEAHNTQKRA